MRGWATMSQGGVHSFDFIQFPTLSTKQLPFMQDFLCMFLAHFFKDFTREDALMTITTGIRKNLQNFFILIIEKTTQIMHM